MPYKDFYKEALSLFAERYAPAQDLFIDLFAATSPRKSLKANFRLADRCFMAIINGENPLSLKGLLGAHKPNILRAINGQPLNGLKVSRFAQNLKGNLRPVTIDVWQKRYMGFSDTLALTPKRYKKLESLAQKSAKRHNLEPAEYQAVCWMLERARAGYKPVTIKEVL
jgi:hypothetical protein